MEIRDLPTCLQDWEDLKKEFKAFEALSKEYEGKLEELGTLQGKCIKEWNHQSYRLNLISKGINKLKKEMKNESDPTLDDLSKKVDRRLLQLRDIEQTLPRASNGTYLKIILGNVNVSILNKNDKFRYKDEYEKFKLVLSIIGLLLSVLNLIVVWRSLELIFLFLLVWYYCTLTIRESILKVNGSRIKGWWRMHHFISTFAAGVLLIWPNTTPWYYFRGQFMWFNCYITFVQYLQFRYQQGVLYRLKALGERHNMDITIEGFHSWMWRGLSFLLPFLFIGYIFQLYNAITLYHLSFHPEATWQIPVLCATFLTLFLGNTITTCMVIPQKFSKKLTAVNVHSSNSDKESNSMNKKSE
ncbi:conserved hypothetical protein [Pediculus humanus corporis]|uniref:Transmembrane protein 120A n=1 Tax=Pediculus humanus subsp. corporis TaxID=121224 RepID=E0VMX0_PEDHC|nr:uncharacterized protein Phum_PHUM320270 [Pediculus humanus corporis]EEB14726.1 conserved hypothetical protein [Pediculus humanus corporis]